MRRRKLLTLTTSRASEPDLIALRLWPVPKPQTAKPLAGHVPIPVESSRGDQRLPWYQTGSIRVGPPGRCHALDQLVSARMRWTTPVPQPTVFPIRTIPIPAGVSPQASEPRLSSGASYDVRRFAVPE